MATPGYPSVSVTTSLTPLPQSVTGISGEAVPAFALPYNRGPLLPTLVTSWQQFTSLYGKFNVANGSYLHYAVYQFFNNAGQACYVLRVPNTDAVTASTTIDGIGSDISTPIMTVQASSPGAWGNELYVQTTPTGGASGRFNFAVYQGGVNFTNLVENFVDLSMNPADPRFISSIVNGKFSGSQKVHVLVTLPSNTYVAGQTDPTNASSPVALVSGDDGSIGPDLGPAIVSQFGNLPDQILNINMPGWGTVADINTVVDWAGQTQQALVIIDPPFGGLPLETSAQVVNNAVAMVNGSPAIGQSTEAIMYSPWLNIVDPSSSVPGATVWVPPGGAVLGIYSDFLMKYGAVQTPAGINADLGVVSLEAFFTPDDLTTLQQNSINAIKPVQGGKIAIMGGRTLQPGFPNQFISVQRVLQQFVHDFKYILQYALFKPNDSTLWASVTATLTNYLIIQMQQGTLAGNTPETSFSVICDASNNPPALAQSGILTADVAVALVSPAEFIIINLSQYQGETTASVAQ